MNWLWSFPARGESVVSGRGDAVRCLRLVEGLRARGDQVTVVADADAPGARLRVGLYRRVLRRRLPNRLATAIRDALRPMHARSHARRVVAAARSSGAEALIETQVHGSDSGSRAARETGLPLMLDDCSPCNEEVETGGASLGAVLRAWRRQLDAASVLTVSSTTLAERIVADGAAEDRVAVVPNAVDMARYPHGLGESRRAQLGGASDQSWIVYAGSFQPWHRVELLVEAVERFDPDRVRVWLLGEGPERPRILERVRELGLEQRIESPGAVPADDMPGWLSACDIGVLPASNDYGQPMKLLEYAAAGLAIVAPDLPTVREVVPDASQASLFATREELVDSLAALVQDPERRRRLGLAARRHAESTPSWKQRAEQLAVRITQCSVCRPRLDQEDDSLE